MVKVSPDAEDFTRSILSRIFSENHYEMSIKQIVCNLNSLDRAGEKEFICYAYESRFEEREKMLKREMRG
ncbi:MAG: hypothetical protein D8M57_04375 [Candidatus Scalindua sp. AMX11]|nr:MAG: hypothetical protein DWQ00_04220 [Candidatus Scalindua sp.]TDE66053.1 MAG: hypothetical protein D8M57_04375 [Candidatus Scalindua sp. AMX11]